VERLCFSVSGKHVACERCKHDSQSCSFLKNTAKESKDAEEVKVKKEPGTGEEGLGAGKVGAKRKLAAKVDDQGTKRKSKKSRASSSASIISIDDSHATSISIPLIPSSSVVSDEDSVMDFIGSYPPVIDADSVSQIFAVLDGILANAEGVVKGAKFLKKAIRDLGLVDSDNGADI